MTDAETEFDNKIEELEHIAIFGFDGKTHISNIRLFF